MADDYEKLKVPDLKKLLKDRNIPSTGLTRKAQYIEKLREWDEQDGSASAPADESHDVHGDANDTDATVTADVGQVAESQATPDVLARSTASSVTLPPDETQTQESAIEPSTEPASDPVKQSPALPPTHTSEVAAQEDVSAHSNEPAVTQPETGAEDSTLTTRVPSEEIIEDNRKRKRRSMTPPVKEDEIALKRQKQAEVNDADVSFTEAAEQESAPSAEKDLDATVSREEPPALQRKQSATTKDVRYKSLFQTDTAEAAQPPAAFDVDYSASLEEAMHPVTRALYIRNFMRPMQPVTLRKHLVSVAEPTWSGGDDADVIEKFHLDQVRTHALVLFTSPERATLARSALHGRVWPAERDRKQLWADFIPEESVQSWIDMETTDDGGGKTGGRRWEVRYSTNAEGKVETDLVELGSGQAQDRRASRPAGDEATISREIPTGPRSMQQAPRATESGNLPVAQGPNTDASFEKLGTLFPSTTAKPIIYHQPVSEEIAAARMEEFAKETSRDWKEKDWRDDDLYRFSFEEGSTLVHSGRHLMSYRVRTREEQITGVRSSVPAPPLRGGRGGYRGGYRGYRSGGNSYRP